MNEVPLAHMAVCARRASNPGPPVRSWGLSTDWETAALRNFGFNYLKILKIGIAEIHYHCCLHSAHMDATVDLLHTKYLYSALVPVFTAWECRVKLSQPETIVAFLKFSSCWSNVLLLHYLIKVVGAFYYELRRRL